MEIPVNLFMWSMACLPIVVLLVLLIKFQWGATEAAPVGLVITALTGIFLYKADITLLASESAKGIWNSIIILLIVWTAILMYQVGNEAKAFQVIRNGMRKLIPNELLLVLAMGWIIESFLQGITGFGVPVAVGAPLLIGIGVAPVWAVIIPLFGQAWGNTFGTLAAAWDSLAMSAGLTPGSEEYMVTALWAAGLLWLWTTIGGFAMCWFYGKMPALKKGFVAVMVLSIIQGGGEFLFSQINTTLCAFIPSCLSVVAVLALSKLGMYSAEWRLADSPIMGNAAAENAEDDLPKGMTLVQAFMPYILLFVITMVVLMVEPINKFLGQFAIGLSFPETVTGYGHVNKAVESFSPLRIFTHASTFLFVASVIGLWYYKANGWIDGAGVKRVFEKSVTMTMPSGIAVIGLVIMSKIMDGTGQTLVLANGIADVLGNIYVILAPFVGLLGTFMTGSNMSSNILFGGFQVTTANLLGVSAPAILGAQTVGGAIGSAISPSKIILGTTTANILGSEGEVLRRIMPIAMISTILIGAIVYLSIVL